MHNTDQINAERIYQILSSYKFNTANEKLFQNQIADVFEAEGIEHKREYRLGDQGIIDFLIGNVGIEIKIKGQKMAIFRQCERYCDANEIKELILVISTSIGFPKEINGKPCYVLQPGKALL